MSILKKTLTFILLTLAYFSFAQKLDDAYFGKLDDELHSAGNNKELINKIIKREKDKYTDSNKKIFFLSYKYANLFLYDGEDTRLLSDNYEIYIKNDNEYPHLTIINCYNLAYLLEDQSPEQSLQFIDKAIATIGKDEKNKILPHLYQLKGYVFSLEDDYDNALKNYKIAYEIFKKRNDKLYMASLLHNFAVCYAHQKKAKEALVEIKNSVKQLKELKQEKSTLDLIYGYKINLGDVYSQLHDYANAISNLEESLAYFEKNPKENTYYINRLNKFLPFLYENTNQANKTNHLVSLSKSIENEETSTEQKILLLEFLLDQSIKQKNNADIKVYHDKLTYFYKKNTEEKFNQNQKISKILTAKSVEIVDNKYKYEKDSYRKKIYWFASTILLSALFLIIFILNQKKKIKQNKLIFENQKKIDEQNRTITEQNLMIKEEKIKHLHLNLSLKNKIEKSFLDKIKTMRKSQKNTDEIMKELTLNLHNLLEIDKKNLNLNEIELHQNNICPEKLKEKFPNLTNKDIELFTYLKLELTAKEIAILENTSDNYIRLRKTKLKTKLGLSKEDNLDDFVKNLT